MIEKNFQTLYGKFRLQLYKNIFKMMGEREGSLTATEFFAVESIYLLNNPTVTEFAECLNISSSLAAYKVRSLIEKGYIQKVPTADKRTFRLEVTEKFNRYYSDQDNYGRYVLNKMAEIYTEEELAQADTLFKKFIDASENNHD